MSVKCSQIDMFDINGIDKLSMESVEQRQAIVERYAQDPNCLFFCSLSGGKDGQSMAILLRKLVPESQIVYVHAHLGEAVEHDGIVDHIKRFLPKGQTLHIVKNERKDFIEMVALRGKFPSAKYRQCTSDLKTGVIDKFIRKQMALRGATIAMNCMGLRSEESVPRAQRAPLFINKRLTLKSGKRTVYDFLPAFHLTTEQVFDTIYNAGEEPFHVYGTSYKQGRVIVQETGNARVSCKFCIMGCKKDLANAATWYPDRYAQLIALERVIGHTMFFKTVKKQPVPVSLAEKAGVPIDEVAVRRWMMVLENQRQNLLAEKALEEKTKKSSKQAVLGSASKAAGTHEQSLSLF